MIPYLIGMESLVKNGYFGVNPIKITPDLLMMYTEKGFAQ
ncbi:hypothetical protein M977_00031 [Buttiauxella gaviniae ATCC 51604]|uniref:Uncharacterized protein n=1 Tax=Buttiauxella gaviniae ATCC 51604 TaxID=1354253 RepID=A0A1B7I6V3_9ENTR|nr:hypothetical protein M977_00031 [Buttiauxella gaviniae ATCC 51604]